MRSVAIILINNNTKNAWKKFGHVLSKTLERIIKQVICGTEKGKWPLPEGEIAQLGTRASLLQLSMECNYSLT